MRVGIVTDGRAEAVALKGLLKRLESDHQILPTAAYADMQPKASPGQIARSALSRVNILTKSKGVGRVVIIIDRENRDDCPLQFAKSIWDALSEMTKTDVAVVVKNKQFENWLIAAPECLAQIRARFKVTRHFRGTVSPDKADCIHAPEQLLNQIAKGKKYHKNKDACQIMKLVDPMEIASNSRSFRRFLRALGNATYRNQSIHP